MGNPLKKINKNYKGTIKDFDKEEVHKFRVGVKKLRALLRLLFYNKTGNINKVPSRVKGLYNCLGNIRNLQLQEERIVQFTFRSNVWPYNYVGFIGSEQQVWKREAGRYKQKKLVKRNEAIRIRKGMKKPDKKQLKAYAIHQSALLQNLLLVEHFKDDDLHELRKILKDILYNWKLIKHYITPLLPLFLEKREDVEAFTVILGEFQDACISLEFLGKEFYPYPESTEDLILKDFRKEVESNKLYLKKRILNMISPSIIPVHNTTMESFLFSFRNGLL
jgi:CHAD domain-containing protein